LIGWRAVGLSNHEIAEFGGDVGRLLARDQVRKSSRRAGGTKSPRERYTFTRLAALGPTMLAHGARSQRERDVSRPAVGTRARINRPLLARVRSTRSRRNVSPRAGARIDPLGCFQLLQCI